MDDFLFGLAQNFIASALFEWKRLRDEGLSAENATFISQLEDQKPIEIRLGQQFVVAFENIIAKEPTPEVLLRLSADDVFKTALAKLVLSDTYSVATILELLRSHVSDEELENPLPSVAKALERAIKCAIAADGTLHRLKELQFQQNVTENFAETSSKQDTILARLQSLTDSQNSIEAQLRTRPILPDIIAEPAIQEHVFNDRVNVSRDLLERGKAKTALDILLDVRKSCNNPSLQLLFRVATNIGSCAMELGDRETAIRELEFALQLQPNNLIALGNGALAALLRREPEEAIRRSQHARSLAPTDSVATSNLIQALFLTRAEDALAQLLKDEVWIQSDANCCLVLAIQFFERGEYSQSEVYLRKAFGRDPDDVRVIQNLAHTLIRLAGAPLAASPVLNWKFPQEAKGKLVEAEELLTRTISMLQNREDPVQLAFSHLLRGDARRLLGFAETALADLDSSMRINPSDQTAQAMKGLTLLQIGNISSAITTFEAITEERVKSTILIQLATAYNLSSRFKETVSLLESRFQKDLREDSQIPIAEHLLWAYAELKEGTPAEGVIGALLDLWPNHSDVLAAIANYRRLHNKLEEAADLYTQALALAKGARRDFIAINLAEIRYEQERFGEAAELYETVADSSSDNELSRRLLSSWYHSGALDKALDLSQKVRGTGEPIAFFSEIEANILAEIGDLETASYLLERLGKISRNPGCLVAAAVFSLRRGDRERARTLFENISLEGIRDQPQMLLCVSQSRAILKLGEVLPYLYQARRSGYHSAEMHAAYAALFGISDDKKEADLHRDVIDVDCAVTTLIGNQTITRVILGDPDLNPDRNEISVETARNLKLLGKRKGDSFVCKYDPFGKPVKCTIVDVQSKYVHAFQDTLSRFNTAFPSNTALQPISAPYEQIRTEMFRQLDEDQAKRNELVKLYLTGRITFEIFSKFLGRSVIDTWGGALTGNYFPFLTSRGSRAEADAESVLAAAADSLLLELTGVLTFSQLDLLPKLRERYKLHVTQPVLDALYEAIAMSSFSRPHLTVGKLGDSYVRQEITAETIERNRRFLDSSLSFLKEHTSLLITKSLLGKGVLDSEFRSFFGPISTSSLFAAREHGIPLYTDDQLLRTLAKRECNIDGTSVQPLLMELHQKGILSDQEYTSALAKLAIFNYSFIALDANAVVWPFRNTGYKVSADVSQLLKSFHGPVCELGSAAQVLADATKKIWFSDALYHQKMDLIDAFSEALSENRPIKAVIETFGAALQQRFVLLPNIAETIIRRIHIWAELKLGRRGLILLS